MKEKIRNKLELLPFLLVVESIICFLLSFYKIYAKIFESWEDITECSLLLCFVLWLFSEDWGVISKKCLLTLFLLNGLNLISNLINIDDYYFYFQSIIYSVGIFLIIYQIWKKK